jgi:mycofactocin glycosyltransferase
LSFSTIDHRRQLWAAALTLPGQPSLRASLIVELAEYLEQPAALVEERCRGAAAGLARDWHADAPATPLAVAAFYQHADAYLYDLTWWHALAADESALVQVRALETARAYHAHTVLDFGSGIGSLGLLLAQHGLAATLADVNPRLNDYARWRFDRRGLAGCWIDLRAKPLPSAAFDMIAAIDVLEHLPDPRAALIQLAAALRPGGVLLAHIPAGDTAHPMHLHSATGYLGHLAAAGLSLEHADGPLLTMRRAAAPRYILSPNLELRPGERGGLIISTRPLSAMRLNAQAFGVLACLARPQTAAEVAAAVAGLSLAGATSFLDQITHRRLAERMPPPLAEWPAISVVVPAHQRPAATRACVESLLGLDYPRELLEVIVVDDASDPPLAAALDGQPIRLLRQEANGGQSAARNQGACVARGELLAFIDNDCVADPGWLRALAAGMADREIGIAGGRVLPLAARGRVAAFEAVRSPLDMGVHGGEVGPGKPIGHMPACNLVIRRELLERLGGFDTAMRLGEDVDLIWRAVRAGSRARYMPAGHVAHDHRVRLGALLRRRIDYGASEADLQRRHLEGRRTMSLPVNALVLLAALVAAPVAPLISAALALAMLLGLAAEVGRKASRLRRVGAQVPLPQVAGAVLRARGAALYHLGANIARYYSIPLLLAGLLWPPLLLAVALLLLIPALTDYVRLRPELVLPMFVGLYWLELLAYQAGVWRGCMRWYTLRPLLPLILLSW